MFTCK